MGRGRGKGKQQSVAARDDNNGSGHDEKLTVRRRGRPQKPLKDNIDGENKVVNLEEEEEYDDGLEETKSVTNQSGTENGRKRKRPSQVNENADVVKEQNGVGTKTVANNDLIKPVGYRQNGSRRKNKPTRAAEVGFECR